MEKLAWADRLGVAAIVATSIAVPVAYAHYCMRIEERLGLAENTVTAAPMTRFRHNSAAAPLLSFAPPTGTE